MAKKALEGILFYRDSSFFESRGKMYWRVDIPARLSPSGKLKRKYFLAKKDAEIFCNQFNDRLLSSGVEGITTDITSAEKALWEGIKNQWQHRIPDLSIDAGMQALFELMDPGVPFSQFLKYLAKGKEVALKEESSITWMEVVKEVLRVRVEVQKRRERTVQQIKNTCLRVEKFSPWFALKVIAKLESSDCYKMLEESFTTPRQRQGAKSVLSGVFTLAVKRGWCVSNPLAMLELEKVVEGEIVCLKPSEVSHLLNYAKAYKNGATLPAVAILFFAGVRPEELTRLTWLDVDFEEEYISVRSHKSKTGGARHVPMSGNLKAILAPVAATKKEGDYIAPSPWGH